MTPEQPADPTKLVNPAGCCQSNNEGWEEEALKQVSHYPSIDDGGPPLWSSIQGTALKTNSHREDLLKAVSLRHNAKAIEARANLEVYLNNPVGVGEHANIVDEVEKLVYAISEAEAMEAEAEFLIDTDKT